MSTLSSELIQNWSDAINDRDLGRVADLLSTHPELGETPFFPRNKLKFYHSATYDPTNYAAMTNDVELMETLFQGGVTPTFGFASESTEMTELVVRYGLLCDAFQESVLSNELITASWFPNVDIQRILLDAGADPNVAKSSSGIRPLMYVALRADGDQSLELARLLIQRGADVNAKSHSGFEEERVRHDGYNHDVEQAHETPLHWAARKGNAPLVRLLLEKGADPDARTTARRLEQFDDEGFYQFEKFEGETPRDWSYQSGDEATIRTLCGDTALDTVVGAARAGLAAHVQSQIDQGADVHAVDVEHGKSAIDYATERGDAGLCRILCNAGARWPDRIAKAIRMGVPQVVRAMLTADPRLKTEVLSAPDEVFRDDLNVEAYHGECVRAVLMSEPESDLDLLLAGYIGDKNAAEEILANRPGVLQRVVSAFPAIACYCVFDAELLRKALDAGASIEERGRPRNSTPLHRAIMTSQVDSVRLLTQRGADVEAERDGGTWRTLDIAICQHQKIDFRIIKLLLDAGANPNVEFHNGYTVLDVLHDPDRRERLVEAERLQAIEWVRAAGGMRAQELQLTR